MSTPVTETVAAPAPGAPPPPAPLASRIADTFFTPTRVFEQFRDGSAPWIGPVLVSLAVLVLLVALRPLFITNRQFAEFMLQKAAEMGQPNLPSVDEMEARVWLQVGIGAFVGAIWLVIRPLLVGGILAALYGLLMGGRAPYRSYVAVASHALLVSTLGFLVVGALQFATGRVDLALDASLLLGPDAKGVAASVLRAVTPFSLWATALLALGGATVNHRRGWLGAASLLLAMQLALAAAGGLIFQLMAAKAGGS